MIFCLVLLRSRCHAFKAEFELGDKPVSIYIGHQIFLTDPVRQKKGGQTHVPRLKKKLSLFLVGFNIIYVFQTLFL